MKSGFSIYLVFIVIAIIVNIYQTIQKHKKAQAKRKDSSISSKNNNQRNTVSEDEREIFKKLQREISGRREEVIIEEVEEDYKDNNEEYDWAENRNYKEAGNTKSMSENHYETHKVHLQTEEERLLELQKTYEDRLKQIKNTNFDKSFERPSIVRTEVAEFSYPSSGTEKNKVFLDVSIRDAVIYNAILERKKINYFKSVQKLSDDKKENTEKNKKI